jgi:hypothetical protein
MLRHYKLLLQYEEKKRLVSTERCYVAMLGDYSYVETEREVSRAPVGSRILFRAEVKVNGCAVICHECGDEGGWAAWHRSRGKGHVCHLHVLIVIRPLALPVECSTGISAIILYVRLLNWEKRLLALCLSFRPH